MAVFETSGRVLARLAVLALLLGGGLGLEVEEARAMAFADGDLYLFNDCTESGCVATGLQLGSGETSMSLSAVPLRTDLASTGNRVVDDLSDCVGDYCFTLAASHVSGPTSLAAASMADNSVWNLQFDIARTPSASIPAGAEEFWFVLTGLRAGPTGLGDPGIDAGYVRGSFSGAAGLQLVSDATSGVINDAAGGGDYLAVRLPLAPTSQVMSFGVDLAFRQALELQGGDEIQILNSAFVASLPEPGTGLLLAGGLAALVLRARRRS